MKLRIEYRDTEAAPCQESHGIHTFEDVTYLNKTVGYEKYRVVKVTAT